MFKLTLTEEEEEEEASCSVRKALENTREETLTPVRCLTSESTAAAGTHLSDFPIQLDNSERASLRLHEQRASRPIGGEYLLLVPPPRLWLGQWQCGFTVLDRQSVRVD